jgi:hypothetical protein
MRGVSSSEATAGRRAHRGRRPRHAGAVRGSGRGLRARIGLRLRVSGRRGSSDRLLRHHHPAGGGAMRIDADPHPRRGHARARRVGGGLRRTRLPQGHIVHPLRGCVVRGPPPGTRCGARKPPGRSGAWTSDRRWPARIRSSDVLQRFGEALPRVTVIAGPGTGILLPEASGRLVGPPVFKTGVRARALRRVRFPSASAARFVV